MPFFCFTAAQCELGTGTSFCLTSAWQDLQQDEGGNQWHDPLNSHLPACLVHRLTGDSVISHLLRLVLPLLHQNLKTWRGYQLLVFGHTYGGLEFCFSYFFFNKGGYYILKKENLFLLYFTER